MENVLIEICKKKYLYIIWIIFLFYLILFGLGWLNLIDTVVYQTISFFISESLTPIIKVITFIGAWESVVTICLICILLHRRNGMIISLNVAIVFILNNIIKIIVQRPRPDILQLVHETSYSFPSGHSMVSFALFMMIAYFLWKKYRVLSMICMIMPLLIGMTRIYLGVHYTTDVIGGFMFSFVYLITLYYFHKRTSYS